MTLSLTVTGGMAARLGAGGVIFSGDGVALGYRGLEVTDARGRGLRAWFALRRGRVPIRVADRGARYPLRIDPSVQQAELTASDGAMSAEFGGSVAMSGSTIAVLGGGALYIFSGAGGNWTQTAELTGSSQLAGPLAMSGSTIAVGVSAQNSMQGAVDVFSNTAGNWSQTAT